MSLAPEQLFSVDDLIKTAEFAEYVAANWLNVGQDDKGWLINRDANWTISEMSKDGWHIVRTDGTELRADDTIKIYFRVVADPSAEFVAILNAN